MDQIFEEDVVRYNDEEGMLGIVEASGTKDDTESSDSEHSEHEDHQHVMNSKFFLTTVVGGKRSSSLVDGRHRVSGNL